MGKGRTGNARESFLANRVRQPDGPFAALKALPRTPAAARASPAGATSVATKRNSAKRDSGDAIDDDTALFRQAVQDVQPLPAHGRATRTEAKPPPLPRPRPAETSSPDPAKHAGALPEQASAGDLFRAAVGNVTPVRDSGRVSPTARPPRRFQANAPDVSPAGGPGPHDRPGAPVLPPLPDIDDPHELFRRAVGTVETLPDRNRAIVNRPLPPPRPRQTEADEQAVLQEALHGPLSVDDRLDMGVEAAFLRDGLPRRILSDLRRGRWVVQEELDLHGLTREAAREALGQFMADALHRGHRCLRLIHGKGLGSPGQEPVLKHLARAWLARRDEILAFCQARPQDGGDGALLILLRAPRPLR